MSGDLGTSSRSKICLCQSGVDLVKSVRFRIGALLTVGLGLSHYLSSLPPMALVCMVGTEGNDTRPNVEMSIHRQGVFLSAISWGQMTTSVTGILADKFDTKFLIAVGVLTGVATANLVPTVVWRSYYALVTLQVFQGICDGIVVPAVFRYIPVWFPEHERSIGLSMVSSGNQIADLMAPALTGLYCSHCDWLGGWPLSYYTLAAMTALWLPVWCMYSKEDPEKHQSLPALEKSYIKQGTMVEFTEIPPIPWRKMATSGPLWAAACSVLCHEIPMMVVIYFLPAYLDDVMKFNYAEMGTFTALPPLIYMIAKVGAQQLASRLRSFFGWNLTKTTKFCTLVGGFGIGSCMFSLGFLNYDHRYYAVVIVNVAFAFSAFNIPGAISTTVCIAPQFNGTVMGIVFFAIGSSGMLVPLLVRAVVTEGLQSEWRIVFIATSLCAMAPCLFYTIWGSAELQPWAIPRNENPGRRMSILEARREAMHALKDVHVPAFAVAGAFGRFDVLVSVGPEASTSRRRSLDVY